MENIELSVEFFPPQLPDGIDRLREVRGRLAAIRPAFFSVTYGAGGSTQERTFNIVREIVGEGHQACPHMTCIGATRDKIRAMLADYIGGGINRIVALRGDLPSGVYGSGEFRYASDLIEFIRAETGEHFHIEVAAYPEWHPQARTPLDDLQAFRRKAEAGASSAITQYFFNPDAYLHYVDSVRALGIGLPIVPGIMPIVSFTKLARFSDGCGAEIPRWMRRKFESYGDDSASVRAFGLDIVTGLCERLLAAGAPGLHFYSMNQAGTVLEICRRLGLLSDD